MAEPWRGVRAAVATLVAAMLSFASLPGFAEDDGKSAQLATAEQFVSAFYSFDPEPLGEILAEAGDSRLDMLFYQGWALGGNYIVMQRMPCDVVDENKARCSITVQDDLVLALGIDFDVTDTFDLTFTDGAITAVETSSNDPQLYHDARDWVWESHPEWVEEPCKGGADAEPDPRQCVSNMLRGYREYARLNSLTPRAAN